MLNAHERTTIRYALQKVADGTGEHVTMAKKMLAGMEPVEYPAGIWVQKPGVIKSKEALAKLLAHQKHGFEHGHFKGSFYMDGGMYSFETHTAREVVEENHHQGDFYGNFARIKVTFIPQHEYTELGDAD